MRVSVLAPAPAVTPNVVPPDDGLLTAETAAGDEVSSYTWSDDSDVSVYSTSGGST